MGVLAFGWEGFGAGFEWVAGLEGPLRFAAVDAEKMKARVLVRLGDGTLLLIDKPLGEGHVMVFHLGI